MNIEWDDNEFPLAYLLTFRTYGTWHHGDERGSVDRRSFNKFGNADITPTVGALEILIPKWLDEGYTITTVSGLITAPAAVSVP